MADNVTHPCTNDSQMCVDGKKAEKPGLGTSIICFLVGAGMTALGMFLLWLVVFRVGDFLEVSLFQFMTLILAGISVYCIIVMMASFIGFLISGKSGFGDVLLGWFILTAAVIVFYFIRGKQAEKQFEEEHENSKSQAPARNVRSTTEAWY